MDLIFGRRSVLEVFKAGKRSIHKLWIASGSHGMEELVALARDHGIPAEFVHKDRLDRMVQGHHQGVVAQVSPTDYLDLDDFLRSLPSPFSGEGGRRLGEGSLSPALSREGRGGNIVLVALDEIQDPHNIGAILRSAGFFGVSAAIVPRWRSAPVGETAARVSSGAIEHVPL